jgi:hypothetical protein
MNSSYIQLIQPNLSIAGQDGECLVYVREVFGVAAKYPTASVAWQNTQYKHANETPPNNVSVSIWFSWETDGHVAVWNNGTIYSTTAQGDKTFPSIQALVDFIQEGIVYLGWSEDINGVRVVQEEEDMTLSNDEAQVLYQLAVPGQPVNMSWANAWTGQNLDDALHALQNDPSIQGYINGLLHPVTPAIDLAELTDKVLADQLDQNIDAGK